jgi:hypothetical protein
MFGGGASADIAALKAELATLKTSGLGVNQDALSLSLKPLQDQIVVADKSAKDALTGVNSVDDKVDLLAGVVDTNSTNTTAKIAALNATITEAKDIAIANDTKISNVENSVPSRDELTLAVADLPKKADKTALESLTTTVTGINTAVSENVAAINGEVAKAAFNASEALKSAATAAAEISKIPGLIQDANFNTNSKTSEIRGSVQDLTVKHNDLSTFVNQIDANFKAIPAQVNYQPAIDLKADKTALAKTDTAATALTTRVTALEGVKTGTALDIQGGTDAVKAYWSAQALKDGISQIMRGFNKTTDIFSARDPGISDVQPEGIVWRNTLYGETTPLNYVSLGNGAWQPLNRKELLKIRVYVTGYSSSWTACQAIRFLDKDSKAYPNNNWIIGEKSANATGPSQGTAYWGQSIHPVVNETCWADFIPSKSYVSNGLIGGLANPRPDKMSTGITKLELYFTGGGMVSFTCAGKPASTELATNFKYLSLDEAVPLVVGAEKIIPNFGIEKTLAELTNQDDINSGRISGAALVAAVQAIVSPTAKTPSQADFDLLVQRITELEAKVNV